MDTGIQFAGANKGLAEMAGMGSNSCEQIAVNTRYQLVPHGYDRNNTGCIWVANFETTASQSRYWLRMEPSGAPGDLAQESRCRDIPVVFDRRAVDLRYSLVKVRLQAGLHYRLSLWRRGVHDSEVAQVVADAECAGLPVSLAQGFNVWYGTCFYRPADRGAFSRAMAALPAEHRPQVSFLGGDQVYLDTAFSNSGLSVIPGFGSRNFSPLALRSRQTIRRKLNRVFSKEYRDNWRTGLGSKLRCGMHYFLAGDHEFWNDYPNPPGFLPVLWPQKVRRVWEACARKLFDAYQSPGNGYFSQFDVSDSLGFFVLDTRLQRGVGRDGRFTDDATFAQVIQWLRTLDRPGVLVLPAPLLARWQFRKPGIGKSLLVRLGFGDHSLADTGQYQDLVRALRDCPQDVLILAGDVHFSRFARMDLGGKQVVEVVSSPLACLPSAVAARDLTPEFFPDRPTDDIRAKVHYWRHEETCEKPRAHKNGNNNFVTLGFKPGDSVDDIQVNVVCWNIEGRDADGALIPQWQVSDLVLKKHRPAVAEPESESRPAPPPQQSPVAVADPEY